MPLVAPGNHLPLPPPPALAWLPAPAGASRPSRQLSTVPHLPSLSPLPRTLLSTFFCQALSGAPDSKLDRTSHCLGRLTVQCWRRASGSAVCWAQEVSESGSSESWVPSGTDGGWWMGGWLGGWMDGWMVCQFPRAAVTNHHRLDDLKHTSVFSYSPGGQTSDTDLTGLKSKGQQDCFPSGSSGGESVSLPFMQLLQADRIPWLVAPSSVFKARNHIPPASASVLTSPSLTLLPPIIRTLVMTWGHRDNPDGFPNSRLSI